MWSHYKLPGNANTPSLTTRKALKITMSSDQFVCIITQRHGTNGILYHTLFLAEEARKLKQCRVV
jgi:hypothetical protein